MRISCCYNEARLVNLFSIFHKKTHKTPQKEIGKAHRVERKYFEQMLPC